MAFSMSLPKFPTRESNSVPRSQAERLWLISGGIVAFVLLLIGYFFFIDPQRSQTSDVNGRVTSVKQQNAVLQAKIDALREENKNLAKWQSEVNQARLALPSTSGVPDFLRSLQSLGSLTHTDVTALSVGQPTPVTAPVGATQPNSDTGAQPSATPTATSSAAPVSVSVYSLAINATVTGAPTALEKFLDQLQGVQPRAVLVTQIKESAATTTSGKVSSGEASLQLTMNAFVAPAVAAAPTTPTATASN
jgi:hypothetical protein